MEINLEEVHLETPAEFDFPFKPYDIQQSFMHSLYSAIEDKKLGIFESPTGTGKSLSIICGAIKWLKDHNRRISNMYEQKIIDLDKKKKLLAENNSSDWLNNQAEELKVANALNQLKLQYEKILCYENKIETIKKNEKTIKRRKIFSQPKSKLENSEDDKLQHEQEKLSEDDLLLDDIQDGDIQNDCDDSDQIDKENEYDPVKIYICSRTHSQLSQFIGEILKSPFGNNIRVASLSSRQNYCINESVTKLKNVTLINERCLDMQKNKEKVVVEDGKVTKKQKTKLLTAKCPYYKQENIEDLKNLALVDILDVEDLVSAGKVFKACPYYASRKAAEDAEIILIPYNTLLHKATREANGIKLKNNVVIVDEAHNLLEALTQMHSNEINYVQLAQTLLQLQNYKDKFSKLFSAKNLLLIKQVIFVLKNIKEMLETNDENKSNLTPEIFTVQNFITTAKIESYNMYTLIKFCQESKLFHKTRNYAMKYGDVVDKNPQKGISQFLASMQNKSLQKNEILNTKTKEEVKANPVNYGLSVLSFLETLSYSYEDGRILLNKSANQSESKLKFLLLNPSANFTDIVREARSVIVAGGTMKPISEFRDRLFLRAGAEPTRIVEFSCDHVISSENILPIIMTKGPKGDELLLNYENRFIAGDSIKTIISECCKRIKGGIVVFFPSYSYENWFWERVKDFSFKRQVFREPKVSSLVDATLENYEKAIKRASSNGALLFSVVGGKLSEGLNFSDELGRCVIVVGMPYANIKALDLQEKMKYLDQNEGCGSGRKFYDNLCMKAVNQCIGRAVRHRNDYANILLLDIRYARPNVKDALPGWIKRSVEICDYNKALISIEKFFEKKNL